MGTLERQIRTPWRCLPCCAPRAQGAAQAVEDGAVIDALFEKAENEAEITDALGIGYRAIMHIHDSQEQQERDHLTPDDRLRTIRRVF